MCLELALGKYDSMKINLRVPGAFRIGLPGCEDSLLVLFKSGMTMLFNIEFNGRDEVQAVPEIHGYWGPKTAAKYRVSRISA